MEPLLQDIDDLLAHLEDYEHGETGRRITDLRGRIQQLNKHGVVRSVCQCGKPHDDYELKKLRCSYCLDDIEAK